MWRLKGSQPPSNIRHSTYLPTLQWLYLFPYLSVKTRSAHVAHGSCTKGIPKENTTLPCNLCTNGPHLWSGN